MRLILWARARSTCVVDRHWLGAGRQLGWLALSALLSGGALAASGPTVKEVVEFTRLVQPRDSDANALQTQIAPDGRHAFIVTRTADTVAEHNVFRIVLLDLDPEHLEADRVAPARTLLTVVASVDPSWLDPAIQDVRWLSSRTLVFRGRINGGVNQAYRLDASTGILTALTHAPTPVVSFAISDDLKQVVYVAQIPKPPLAPGARSVVVANQSFWSVKWGQDMLLAQDRQYRYFAIAGDGRGQARPLGPVFAERSNQAPGVSLSPDGRWALLPRYEVDRQLEWAAQYPLVGELVRRAGPSLSIDPIGYFSRPRSYVVRTMVAHRLADDREQLVVDAPDDAYPGVAQTRSDRLWLDGGKSVVIAGTHLPLAAGHGNSSHVIEYWPDTGRVEVITDLDGRLESAYRTSSSGASFVAMDGSRKRAFERNAAGQWREVDRASGANAGATDNASRWSLRLEQALDVAPNVWAIGPSGERIQLTNLNPNYVAGTWGTASAYSWKDAHGRQWDGGLLLPSGEASTQPRPLVIQTYGFRPDRFYLDGTNFVDGASSAFAGRAFLREGFIVLAIPLHATTDAPSDERGRVDAFADGVRGAIETLVAQGLVDRERIGLIGWSATGEQSLNLVTFTDIPIRAVTVADGDANTMFSIAITYGAGDGMVVRKEAINGGPAYGPTLESWVRSDPALHTDCVRAAMRIETYSPVVLNNWDVYALLRRQYKPAEMIVIPAGLHSLSNPGDRMVSLQGNVDWFRFWLKDEERLEPMLVGETVETLQNQYVRWRQMAQLRQADQLRPPCASAMARRSD